VSRRTIQSGVKGGGGGDSGGGRRLAVFTKNRVNPNYAGLRLGADRTGAALGFEIVHHVPVTPDDAGEQIALLEDEIARRPAAILLNPADVARLAPAVGRIAAAGIPLVGFINRVAGPFVTFVGADERRSARMAATWLIARIGGSGEVVVLEGTPGASTARERLDGYLDAIAAFPAVRLAGRDVGHYLEDEGRAAMFRLLARLPRIDGVIATNDTMALGAVAAMQACGRPVSIVGHNAIVRAAEAIEAGSMTATVAYDAYRMGGIAVAAAAAHLAGRSVPAEIMLPIEIVHRGNAGPWRVPPEARPLPNLAGLAAPLPSELRS
jgi:ribose transport system substrate-binding protein